MTDNSPNTNGLPDANGPDSAAEAVESATTQRQPETGFSESTSDGDSAAAEARPDEDVLSEEDLKDPYDSYEGDAAPIEESTPDGEEESEESDRRWYILKVQSNREKSICDGLQRRVKVAGLDDHFGEIIVPTEDVAEFKNGKRRVVKRKLYPGYIVVNMTLNDETWFVVRETPGIGDFTGAAGTPTPMLPEEVDRIVRAANPEEEGTEQIKTAIPFKLGDRVRIKEGTFENFEGDVEGIDEANGRVTVTINIFGRSTPVELEHWQIESV